MRPYQLQAVLAIKFPKVWIKDGALFDAALKDSLWTGEGSEHTVQFDVGGETEQFDMPVFDMYSGSDLYEFGVLKEFAEFLRERGYFAEAYDGGTFFIWKA